MQRLRLKPEGTLQRFEQSEVLGDIIVLAPDRFGDSDGAACGAVNDDSNTRRAGIPEGAAIGIGHEIRHCGSELVTTMRQRCPGVKMLAWSLRTLPLAPRVFERLWMFLCKNGRNLISLH